MTSSRCLLLFLVFCFAFLLLRSTSEIILDNDPVRIEPTLNSNSGIRSKMTLKFLDHSEQGHLSILLDSTKLTLKPVKTIYHPHAKIFSANKVIISNPASRRSTFVAMDDAVQMSITFQTENSTLMGTLFHPTGVYSFSGQHPFRFSHESINHGRKLFDKHQNKRVAITLKPLLENVDNYSGKRKRDLESTVQFDPKVSRFTDCYSGDDTAHFLDIGIATDYSFFLEQGSIDGCLAKIEEYITNTNIVYQSQLNVFLRVKQIILVPDFTNIDTGDSAEHFFRRIRSDQSSTISDVLTCLEANDALAEFQSWVARIPSDTEANDQLLPVQQGLWHLITSCYKSGTIGIAVREDGGTVCDVNARNTGLSSVTFRQFVNFAHEIGHNFGSKHSFEKGVGVTGGIMDYGNGYFQGTIQFRPARKDEICGGLQSAAVSEQCIANNWFTSFDSECGFSSYCTTGAASDAALALNMPSGGGICINGACKAMSYSLVIGSSTFSTAGTLLFSNSDFAEQVPVGSLYSGNIKFMSKLNASNSFGCKPFANGQISTSSSSSKDIIMLEYVLGNDDESTNCSFLTKANHAIAAGYDGMMIYTASCATNSANCQPIVIDFTDEELLSSPDMLSDFQAIYLSGVNAQLLLKFFPQNPTYSAGWTLSDTSTSYSILTNPAVPVADSAALEVDNGNETTVIAISIVSVFVVTSLFLGIGYLVHDYRAKKELQAKHDSAVFSEAEQTPLGSLRSMVIQADIELEEDKEANEDPNPSIGQILRRLDEQTQTPDPNVSHHDGVKRTRRPSFFVRKSLSQSTSI